MATTSITVSYSGVEKRVPLAIKPSIELSDAEVNTAESDLHSKLRQLFQVPNGVQFYLHEAETQRVMSKESFREYTVSFPSHWYLVNPRDSSRPAVGPQENGIMTEGSTDDLIATLGLATPPEMTTPPSDDTSSEGQLFDEEDETIPQLAELTALPEESYSTVSLTCSTEGSFGMTLRHFTIQSDSSQRPETPEDYERPTSRLSTESTDLKLSTTFIHRLTKGGVAKGAGLEEGQMVHMLNGTSILRSNADEIRRLVEECGEVLTLLTLPKEHDDLQFLYPRYTYGPSGEYSTKDGQVTATDIKVDRGSKVKSTQSANHVAPSNHVTSVGVTPPSGMMVFNDMDYTSQENSQTSDPRLPRQPVHDDVLVEGSLLDIETIIPSRAGSKGKSHGANRSSEWYNDPDGFSLGQDVSVSDQIIVETAASETNLLGQPRPLPVKVRTRSNSSLEGRHQVFVPSSQGTSSPSDSISSRTALTSSMSALDRFGRNHGSYNDRARSTDLGRIKIKKGGNKSLEGLTRIASDGLQQRLSIRPLNEGNKSSKKVSSSEEVKSEQPTMNQGVNREISREMSQSSRISNESTSSLVNDAPARPNKKRGYQNMRRELHSRSRSRVSAERAIVGGSVESDLSTIGRNTVQGQRSPSISQDNETSPTTPVSRHVEPLTPEHRTLPKLDEPVHQESRVSVLRNSSFSSQSPPNRPQRFNRPMSAIESTLSPTTPQSLQVPFSLEPSKKIPLFKTRSIGDQVVREVNIEEAIQASQASQGDRGRVQWPAGPSGRSLSMDVGSVLDGKKKTKKLYQRKKQASIDLVDGSPAEIRGLGSAIHRLSSEVLNTLGLSTSPSHQQEIQTNIQCHGVLSKKQDLLDSGRRAGDRSWRSFYAVLASNTISFYKDRKEARLRSNCEEPSIDVVPSKADYARDYKNKKFVFRVVTGQGASYLLQASDAPSLKNWVTTIQDLNGGPPTPDTTLQRSKDSDSKLAPPSPLAHRRASSPQSGRGGRKLFNRLKNKLARNKDEPDMSSYVTFGQPLEECPVSAENKRVPLVVEYCVNAVESLGLDVEGIYRKPGHVALIKHMSSEMDKGVYEFNQDDIGDVHTVASLCKKFFKELPDPMIPSAVHEDFLTCARTVDEGDRYTMLKELVHELPTAHYHTLKYLMKHLREVAAHSDVNKMTYRNVALVFGPTLMRGAAQDMLFSMNESYTIVETLCKHVEHLFDELCAEELRQTEGPEVVDEVATRGTPTHLENRQQKDTALATASPQSLRRIRNNLGEHPSDSLQPKQTNWEPPIRGANRSIDSGVSSPGDQQRSPDNMKPKPRIKRHAYEDVERPRPVRQHTYEDVDGLLQQRSGSESRTSSWVSTHSEMGWGKRETSGSMWAPQNRTKRAPRRQESFERDRDLTGTYHAPPRAYSGRPRNASTLPTSLQQSPVKRRISYISAMGKETERLTTSYAAPETQSPTRYSQQTPSHRQFYASGRGYDSLQRGSTTNSVPRPRRGSQSSEYERMQEAKAMLLQGQPTKVSPVHRTRSHGVTRNTGQGITRTPSGRQSLL